MTRTKGAAILACAALGLIGASGLGIASCAQTPVNVPVRTFERAQRVDVVCLKVRQDQTLAPIPPEPQPQAACAPVPAGVDGTQLQYHLYALVTQTSRGEVAVVDLTGGFVVDVDLQTPGINFLPVGNMPTDVATLPGGEMAFVGAAEPNKPAIYGLPGAAILGDSQQLPSGGAVPLLTSWPACALPQAPSAITVVPRHRAGAAPDGGAGDAGAASSGAAAGSDAGAPSPTDWVLAVVLPGGGGASAKVVTIDPLPFLRGAGISLPADSTNGRTLERGELPPCIDAANPPLGVVELAPPPIEPPPATAQYWSDGVPYTDASPAPPPVGGSCATTIDGGANEAGANDAGDDGGASEAGGDDAGGLDAGAIADAASDGNALPPIPRNPHASGVALDTDAPRLTMYVGDDALPIIHVLDLTDPTAPRELPPLRATSLLDPARSVSVGAIAVSPTTRDYKRYLYAIDATEGTVMVFDVTDPVASPRTPLLRPHPELNPFQPPDRLAFNAPVAALSFVRHDFPLQREADLTDAGVIAPPRVSALTGVVCNPNPNIDLNPDPSAPPPQNDNGPFSDPGGYYRANSQSVDVPLGPARLRGIFAFVTLANGQVETVDVDDWDAPCRRPDPMTRALSAIAPAEPPAGPGDTDPYHVPIAFDLNRASPVSLETFFPVSAPNRPRSFYPLRNDPTTGIHIPYLVALPQLLLQGAPVTPGFQPGGEANPLIVAPTTPFVDPSLLATPTNPVPIDAGPPPSTLAIAPAVRLSTEDPLVHVDQDWSVTYEGALPGFDGLSGQITPNADAHPGAPYGQVILQQPHAGFCGRGVEDFTLAQRRADAAADEMRAHGLAVPPQIDHWTTDYVQILDALVDPSDPYWDEEYPDGGAGSACWDGRLARNAGEPSKAADRRAACVATFGETLDPANESPARDFPIIEAYDDHFVLGRYAVPPGSINPLTPTNRIVQAGFNDDELQGNQSTLKMLRCCFHSQVTFRVRTGGQWVALASQSGYLNHVAVGDGGRCVQSCDPRKQLLNARAPTVSSVTQNGQLADLASLGIGRDSALAMRNPMLSFVVWDGRAGGPSGAVDARPQRDMSWRFTTRGSFAPYVVNIAATTTAVSPQSMRFIDSLGQLAVVDGASQGLVLIDLSTISLAHAPYF